MTTENITPDTQLEENKNGTGCLGQVGLFLSGAVLPMGSLSFYQKAVKKSVGNAILFFVFFTLVISSLSTINIAVGAFSAIGSIENAFADGDVPEILIENGIAEVSGEQPFVLIDGPDASGRTMFVGIDTSDEITRINSSYYQGFLLTRTKLHMITPQNGYQVIPLSELNRMFEKDPITINAETVSQAWATFSTIFVILAFFFLILWHTIVRLMIISMIALIIWGIVSLLKPNTGFGPIIITGLYAIVPAIYISHLFSRSNFGFPGVQTFFLLVFWVPGLTANLVNTKFFAEEQPLRLRTALIGFPMLLLFIVDIFWQFQSPYDSIALWVVSLLTWLVLVGLRLFLRLKSQKTEQL